MLPNIWDRFRRSGIQFPKRERPQRRLTKRPFRKPSATVPSLDAGPCPNGHEGQTRVYEMVGQTDREIAKCVCDTCGESWEQQAERELSISAFCARLVKELEALEALENADGDKVVILTDDDAEYINETLRTLISQRTKTR